MDSAKSTTVDPQTDTTPATVNLEGWLTMLDSGDVSGVRISDHPVAIPNWPGPGSGQDQDSMAKTEDHEVLKLTGVHSKSSINVDDLVGMSKLTLGDGGASTLLKVGELSRQLTFHASNPGARTSNLDSDYVLKFS